MMVRTGFAIDSVDWSCCLWTVNCSLSFDALLSRETQDIRLSLDVTSSLCEEISVAIVVSCSVKLGIGYLAQCLKC